MHTYFMEIVTQIHQLRKQIHRKMNQFKDTILRQHLKRTKSQLTPPPSQTAPFKIRANVNL